jgi:hypothetical protein
MPKPKVEALITPLTQEKGPEQDGLFVRDVVNRCRKNASEGRGINLSSAELAALCRFIESIDKTRSK